MKARLIWSIMIVASFASAFMPSGAYELRTHANMTLEAHRAANYQSVIRSLDLDPSDSSQLSAYYYDLRELDARRRDPAEFEVDRMPKGNLVDTSIPGWLVLGAIREDDLSGDAGGTLTGVIPRPLSHR
jgi:hypothetical protein